VCPYAQRCLPRRFTALSLEGFREQKHFAIGTYLQSAAGLGRTLRSFFQGEFLETMLNAECPRNDKMIRLDARVHSPSVPPRRRFAASSFETRHGFTLLELLIVVGIVALLMVLIAPAFTTIKGGSDVTSAAYTIKGVLDTARTYAKANNTYTWVGFYEENVNNPASPNSDPPAVGRIIMSIVASTDGTNLASGNAAIDPTKLIQVGKLTKIGNLHLATFTDGSGTGSTFDTRPPVTFNGTQYTLAGIANSTTPFQYPVGSPAPPSQYTFLKAVQFSPRGEAQVNNNTNSLQTAAEIAFEPTHGATVPASIPANVVAVQFTGLGGAVKIYRR
jgi:prepilin-type N-terminal cleavage/methylation domain-containing protein